MAYLRFTDDCKVYFLLNARTGMWECCGCFFTDRDSARFSDIEDAIDHLHNHYVAGHIGVADHIRVLGELRGEQRRPDLVLADMAGSARAAGSKIASDDADIPEDLRMNFIELIDFMIEEARKNNDDASAAGLLEAREEFLAKESQ